MSWLSKIVKKVNSPSDIVKVANDLNKYIEIKPETVAVTKAIFFQKCEALGVNKSTALLLWSVVAGAFKAEG